MPTDRRRLPPAVAATVGALLALSACAAPVPEPSPTLAIDVADGSPTGDSIAIPGGLDAGVERGLAALPAIIERVLTHSGVPGMSVAVVLGDETAFAEGYGTKVAGADDPVGASTVFQVASVSKSLTGTIIAKAVSDGILEWDTPVRQLLPDFSLADPYVTQHATIADYMTHRSGLYTGAGDDLETLGFDRATILERLRLLPLDAFRSTYNYSNFGITVAGEATAAAAGTDWETLAEKTLFAPLGMTSTSARYADYLARPDRATINALVDGGFAPLYERDPDPESPAGGVSSNVIDLAEWMKLVLAGGERDGDVLIAEDALLPAISGQIVSGRPSALGDRGGEYGYGFNVGTALNGRPTVSHSGAFILGTGTNFRLLPGLGLGIVALTNGSPVGAAEAVVSAFLDVVLYGHETRDWAPAYEAAFAHYFEPEGDLVGATRPADATAPRELATYAGAYLSDYYGDLEITVDGDGLLGRLGPTGSFEIRLTPWDGDVFAFDVSGEEAPAGSRSSAAFDVTGASATSVTLAYFDRWGLGTFDRAP
ncbi:MAG TPA: serine hydrolase [Microbacteriaceae bacterium]|nr:serine hydrolase [Microbacteriaceae bacterium]